MSINVTYINSGDFKNVFHLYIFINANRCNKHKFSLEASRMSFFPLFLEGKATEREQRQEIVPPLDGSEFTAARVGP